MAVYIVHFDKKICDRVRHYIGTSIDPKRRFKEHQGGRTNALFRVAREQSIGFKMFIIDKDGGRADERRYKAQKNAKYLCPLCKRKKGNRR